MNKFVILIMSISGLIASSCCNTGANKEVSAFETSTEATQVELKSGSIAGYIDRGVYIYKGIPYAKAERFMPPTDPDSWEGVRSCRAFGPTAPQDERMGWLDDEQAFVYNWNDGFPGEDCLRVNVWTNGINDNKKRAVMVWLHGGGFHSGSGQELPSYDGLNMARNQDVVVVSLNHRLNALGYLDLSAFGEKYAYSGNAGMLDIVKALEWVQNNISAFGGDPSNVTIFGQSGGGGKVSAIMSMPKAKGLFHKAIVQSGSITRVMDQKWARKMGAYTVEELGLNKTNIDAIQSVDYKTLLAACNKAIEKTKAEAEKAGELTKNILLGMLFGTAPVVDGVILPAHPDEEASLMLSKDIPTIIGTVYNEFTPMMEDPIFRPLAIEQAGARSQACAPVYMYLFTWESPVLGGKFKSNHCFDIPFVFDNVELHASMSGGAPEDVEFGHRVSTAWANFAKTGVPSAPGLPEWLPYSVENEETMILNNESTLRTK